MIFKTKTIKVPFKTLKPPRKELLESINELKLDFQLNPYIAGSPALAEDAAMQLLQEHPITIWRMQVVAGLPTYWYCSPLIGRETIVAVNELPSKIPRESVIAHAKQSLILGCLIYSINAATHSLYAACNELPDESKINLVPVFAENIMAAAAKLKVNRSHLSNVVKKRSCKN